MFKKTFIIFLLVAFVVSAISLPQQGYAKALLGLPEPGTMVFLSAPYQPALLKGITVNPKNPFQFDFIVDIGQDKLAGAALKTEGERMINYFLAALAIPAKDLWVNLSPYEKDRTIPEALSQTEMGRDLLAQDYLLKQITASLIYPEKELGKRFWDHVYMKIQGKYGHDVNVPVNTFNKVWILSDNAEVFEHGQTAFVTKCHLKVMLEEDYLATQKNKSPGEDLVSFRKNGPIQDRPLRNTENSQLMKEIILPELEREINEGHHFANLRQIYQALVLASWYKKTLKSSLLTQSYADHSTINGISMSDTTIKEQIYNRYLQAYKKGVFNFIKEENSTISDGSLPASKQGGNVSTPRKYFSGGMIPGPGVTDFDMTRDETALEPLKQSGTNFVRFDVGTTANGAELGSDGAMPTIKLDNVDRAMTEKTTDADQLMNIIGVSGGPFDRGDAYRENMAKVILSEVQQPGTFDDVYHALIQARILSAMQVASMTGSPFATVESNVARALQIPFEKVIRNSSVGLSFMEVSYDGIYSQLHHKIAQRPEFNTGAPDSFLINQTSIGENGPIFNQIIRSENRKGVRVFQIFYVPNEKFENVFGLLRKLWGIVRDKTLPLQQRLEAIAKIEWWIVLSNNFYGRAAASIADGMSLIAQLSNGVPLRQSFEHIDFDVLSMTLDEYVPYRTKQFQNKAQAADYGGIDLVKTEANMSVSKDVENGGVQMSVDPALVEKVRNEGIRSLKPIVLKIAPVVNIWQELGIKPLQ